MKTNYAREPHVPKMLIAVLIIFLCLLFFHDKVFSQYSCGANTPSFTVNLTGQPNGSWISPVVVRNDTCCGSQAPDKCVQFEIILDSTSQGISFDIYSGSVPTGSMFYQINCGPPASVGNPICLTGIGPFYLSFCKPGNNSNQYIITSISKPSASGNIILNQGCTGIISAIGYQTSTITWTSVYPGPNGTYNSYLNCASGCDTTTVTAQPGFPPYVDYMVCGIPIGGCANPVCDTVRVFFNPTLFSSIVPANPTICYGASSTTITATATGGTPPYSYQWNTGQTMQTISVGVGNYSVIIYDASNCPPTTASVTVTSFANPIVANAGNDITVCAQNPVATLSGNITGASGGIWINGGGNFSPNNTTLNTSYTPSSGEINNGSAILFLITTGNGTCPADTDSINIFINQSPNISVLPANISCFGGNNGIATANVSGGTPPYSYHWLPCGCTVNPIHNLAAGSYTAIVTDASGCSADASAIITQPAALIATTSVNGNVSCAGGNNGSASINISGGTPNYFYAWSNGSTTSYISNLAAGNYSVTVTDNNGCTIADVITISQPTVLSTLVSQQDVSCYGMTNGSASVSTTGGSQPYSYQWNNGQTTSTITGLGSGNYFVTVTDSKGCKDVQNIFINQPSQLALSIFSLTNVSCFGGNNGSATAISYGGVAPYSYMWNTIPTQTNATASGLSSGNYIVTVLDSNGCSQMVSINITEPSAIYSSMNSSNVKCYGGNSGSATVNVSGGTPNYYYVWSNGQTNASAINLSAGNYSIIITDANGCTHTNTVSVTQPALLTAGTINAHDVSCFGMQNGSATLGAGGGTAPYFFSWSNGSSTNSVSGLSIGNYSVVITDANGCTATAFCNISQPNLVSVTTTSGYTVCPGNNVTISANASGGTPSYSYFWQPTAGFGSSQTVNPTTTTNYTVIVSDSHGCTASGTVAIFVYNPAISVALNATPAICAGQSATLTTSLTGNNIINYYWSNNLGNAAGPYIVSPSVTTTYSVTVQNICGNSSTSAATIIVHPLPQISLTPQNGSGCDEVSLQFSDTNSANNNSTYNWNFGDGQTGTQMHPSHAYSQSGNYIVTATVISQYGCSSSAQTNCSVTVFESPVADFSSDPPVKTSIIEPVFHFTDESKHADIWNWDFGDGNFSAEQNPLHTYQQEGVYTVKLVTKNNGGCIDSVFKILEVKPEFTFYVPNTFTPNGDHHNDIFSGKGLEITEFSMQIYDRWGEMIYETFDLEKGWDGTAKGRDEISPEGVYVYKIKLRDFDHKEHNYVGNVNLVH